MPGPPTGFATLRDALTFLAGLAVLAWVVIVRDGPIDPIGVGLGVMLVGLPVVLLPTGHGHTPPPPPTAPTPTPGPPRGTP